MLTLRPGASSTRIILVLIYAIWFGLPCAAILGQLGLLRSTVTLQSRHFSQNGDVLRLKKSALPVLTQADLRHAYITQNGRRFDRKQAIHELSQPGSEASYVLRSGSLNLRPAPVGSSGNLSKSYSLVRPWAPRTWLWWVWGASSLFLAAALLRSRPLLDACYLEVAQWRHLLKRVEHHPVALFIYVGITTALLAAANWQKLSDPYLVAEDGSIFIEDNLAHGIGALFVPYAGYLHVLPRLIAWASGGFSLDLQPAAFVWVTLGMVSLTFYFIGSWTGWAERLAITAFFTIAPLGGYLMFSPTNLQWITGLALVLLAIHPSPRPTTPLGQILLLSMAFVAALSGPFAILTLPAMIWRAWSQRNRFEITLALSQAVAAGIQIAILIFGAHEPAIPEVPRGPLLLWVADFALGLFGRSLPFTPTQFLVWGMILAAGLSLLFASAHFLWKGHPRGSSRLLWMLFFASLFAAAGYARTFGSSRAWLGGDRYYVIPYALVILALATLFASRRRLLSSVAIVLLISMMCGLGATDPPKIRPPHWPTRVQQIKPGRHDLIETYPPGDDQWSVFIVKGDDGTPLTGPAYLKARARLDTRAKRPGHAPR